MPTPSLRSPVARAIDLALEASIVGSFSRIGADVRSRLDGWTAPDVAGRAVAVTGATSGIGLAAAQRLAEGGAEVVLIGRSERKLDRAVEVLDGPGRSLDVERCDLGDLDDVADLAVRLAGRDRLDVVVHNAGALLPELTLSPQGIETTLATHVVGPFLLTSLLVSTLAERPAGRFVTVSSGGMYATGLSFDQLVHPSPYDGVRQYSRAKRAQVLLNRRWATRHPLGPSFMTMHPGWADTPGVASGLPTFGRIMAPLLRTAAEGADTIVWLAGRDAEGEPTGGFYHDRRRRPTAYLPGTDGSRDDVDRLWAHCTDLCAPYLPSRAGR